MEDARKTYIRVLESLLALHHDLIAVLEREADAMVRHDVGEIEKAVLEEEALVEGIRASEQKRQKVLARMGRNLNTDLTWATLRDIAEISGGEYKGIMLRLRSELQKVAEELAKKNKLKMLLCEQSLAHVRMMLRFLTGNVETGLYTSGGVIEEKSQQVILDQKV